MNIEVIIGDICKTDVDVIVNAANSSLLGGGGVDGAIHRAAGKSLLAECLTLNGCKTGEAKFTNSYNLKKKGIIHTVGPIFNQNNLENSIKLLSFCYRNSLLLAESKKIESISFPCISTGVYQFPNDIAADIAIKEVMSFNSSIIKKVVFCCFLEKDYLLYKKILEEKINEKNNINSITTN